MTPAIPEAPSPVIAVVTAAGSGSRLGAELPKGLVPLAGQSLVRRAVRGMLASGVLERVVVTAPEGRIEGFRREVADLGAVEVVAGSSASRQASVALGLEAALRAQPDAALILVHDAARALTPPDVIQRVVAALREGHEAVIPVMPVTDTIKEVRSGEAVEPIVATPDRARLRAVQTPQGFARETLLAAHRVGAQRAASEGLAASDDAGLVEAMGGDVVAVAGDARALKVTTGLDLLLAEALLAAEEREPARRG
ncbi:2-C-methyl-D-erythritol 4-phosphate cytidylyltransferase [Actinomyces timonensis]|uniref:2-C-methyl-D-erythritol 4-phosphate cytidylyltransferase n=1 Tax=Actinomyces timonensis TaxID=1288391 RepID=A0AAU8N2B2_9ACTO